MVRAAAGKFAELPAGNAATVQEDLVAWFRCSLEVHPRTNEETHNTQRVRTPQRTQIPIYDFKQSCRSGYQTLEVPQSRIVIIEGIYALNERLRPLLDLRVSVTGATLGGKECWSALVLVAHV